MEEAKNPKQRKSEIQIWSHLDFT